MVILILLFLIYMRLLNLYFSPVSAYKQCERSAHYGPSEVIHTMNADGYKYIVGKYDRWLSLYGVKKVLLFFWMLDDHSIGYEMDDTEDVNYGRGSANSVFQIYGVVNNNKIKTVEFVFSSGNRIDAEVFPDQSFLKSAEDLFMREGIIKIRGYDEENKMIYEKTNY